MPRIQKAYAFIDASNLFYGGEKSLGWKIDYQKLFKYLKEHYKIDKVFYYGGIELEGFIYSVLESKPINLDQLIKYFQAKQKNKGLTEGQIIILDKRIQRAKFYRKLKEFGYHLKLKPVKIFRDEEGNTTKKANCDVDMTFDLMRHFSDYSSVLVLTGDGDFAVILKYLQDQNKKLTILARAERTAREIRQLAGSDFRDFNYLREILKFGA